jgi:hypothetical protein
VGISNEKSTDQVFETIRERSFYFLRKFIGTFQDPGDNFLGRLAIKWEFSTNHSIENASYRPNINCRTEAVAFVRKYFWGHIGQGANVDFFQVDAIINACNTEIDNFDQSGLFRFQKDVLHF